MRKRMSLLLALCLLLSGCGAAPVATVSTTPKEEVTIPATEAAVTQPAPQPVAAPQRKEGAGRSGTYRAVPEAVDPASQAYYDSLNRESEVFAAFDAVMNGNKKFTNVLTGNSTSLATAFINYPGGQNPTLRQLTMTDLDQDGTPELILWLKINTSAPYGYLLLNYYGGEVYGRMIGYDYFQELKTDGSFVLTTSSGAKAYARMKDLQNSPEIYASDPEAHSAKADVIWYPQWQNLIYPGASSQYNPIVGVLADETALVDTARQERINLAQMGQLLMPEEVQTHIVQCTSIDLDWDGITETILQVGTESDDHVGFVVLREGEGQYLAQAYYYRTFFRLRTDGSYTFSSGASDSGYGMLTFQNGQWMETVLAQTYENSQPDGSTYQIYFVGGEMTTEEDYNRFVQKQEAKDLQRWYPNLTAMNAAMR